MFFYLTLIYYAPRTIRTLNLLTRRLDHLISPPLTVILCRYCTVTGQVNLMIINPSKSKRKKLTFHHPNGQNGKQQAFG